jgi:hypothetical protein
VLSGLSAELTQTKKPTLLGVGFLCFRQSSYMFG